jgi:hypothetical protein
MVKITACSLFKISLLLFFPISVSGNTQNVPVDCAFDDNINDFQYYWDYYDDNRLVGKNDRPQAANPGISSMINVNNKDTVRHAFGDTSDNHVFKCYEFTTGEENGNRYATMPFTFGSDWKTTWGKTAPYVGITTGLVRSGSAIDLREIKSVRFKVRSRKNSLKVRFKLHTFEIDSISNVPADILTGEEFGYYSAEFSTNAGIWSTITISLDSLVLPGTWARNIPFNPRRCTKLAWEISGDTNEGTTSDTLDIDDVLLCPSYHHCHEEWTLSEPLFPLPGTGQFLNFEPGSATQIHQNRLFYGFTEKILNGKRSTITNGIPVDTEAVLFTIPVTSTANGSDIEHCLQLSFQNDSILDPKSYYTLGGLEIHMFDSARNSYWNASTGTSKIYFHYKTDEKVRYLIFEVFDDYDYTTPIDISSRIDNEGNAARWKYKLLNVDDEWQAAALPLNSLSFCYTLKNEEPEPLHLSKIAKFRWSAVGQAGTGSFAIDNIYFPGVDFSQTRIINPPQQPSILKDFKKLSVSYRNGNIKIGGLTGELFLKSMYYAIHNSRGQKILHGKILPGIEEAIIPDRHFSAGMYIISISSCADLGKNTKRLPLFVMN